MTGATWTEGIVLRYGGFYGPGTGFSLTPTATWSSCSASASSRSSATGEGVWSFVHIEDAATATVAAIEHGSRGVYNVVDDEPGARERVAAGAPRRCSAPASRCACRAGSGGSRPARRRSS